MAATCPNCGMDFKERDQDEPVYRCQICGIEGFDCCVPGNNAICFECTEGRKALYTPYGVLGDCSYCGFSYPIPVEYHHTKSECQANQKESTQNGDV